MSQWTHIRGCLGLNGSALEKKQNKKTKAIQSYLPYPDTQLKISAPISTTIKKGEVRGGIDYKLQVYCLPRCQEFIDQAMKLLPSGEYNIINYSTYQAKDRFRSSSSWAEPCEKKIFKERILKQYQAEEDYPLTWNQIKKRNNINIAWVEYATEFTLTIHDDIRHCSGPELLVALEKALNLIIKNGITIEDGILDWTDEWADVKFQCTADWNTITFKVYNSETGLVLATKKYKSDWNSKTKTFEKSIEQSENWNTFIPEVLYEQENRD